MTSPAATVPAVPDLVFTDQERLALAGFLAGHRGLTREAYALDLRQFVALCERRGLKLFSVRRAEIELYARALEDARASPGHRGPAAVHGRRLLSVRLRGRPSASVTGSSRLAPSPGLRVPRRGPRP
jgi:hypothetical protein